MLRLPRLLRRKGGLDLHDVSPEAGEQLRRVRQSLHLLQRQDAHALKRLASPVAHVVLGHDVSLIAD
jgi:hypothetical protein